MGKSTSGSPGNKRTRKIASNTERYEYKRQFLTVAQILKIKGWPWSVKQTYRRLRAGLKVKDLMPAESSERAKKIMSVPINPMKTQAHYMTKFSIRTESNLGAVDQTKGRDV